MSSVLRFDFTQRHYGPATASIRQLLSEWSEVEWPAPPRIPRTAAHQLFSEHHRAASSYLPAKLAPRVHIVPATGGWEEFATLCQKVRNETCWSWKYNVLKPIARAHADAHGWTKEEVLRQLAALPDLSDFFLRIGDGFCWTLQWEWPPFDGLAAEHAESARFYYEYCAFDFTLGLDWQLAEPGCRLEDNLFHGLLRLYAAGYYPFSRGPDSVVMFSFANPE